MYEVCYGCARCFHFVNASCIGNSKACMKWVNRGESYGRTKEDRLGRKMGR